MGKDREVGGIHVLLQRRLTDDNDGVFSKIDGQGHLFIV